MLHEEKGSHQFIPSEFVRCRGSCFTCFFFVVFLFVLPPEYAKFSHASAHLVTLCSLSRSPPPLPIRYSANSYGCFKIQFRITAFSETSTLSYEHSSPHPSICSPIHPRDFSVRATAHLEIYSTKEYLW